MAADLDLQATSLAFYRPPAKLTLSQWADEFAVLSAES